MGEANGRSAASAKPLKIFGSVLVSYKEYKNAWFLAKEWKDDYGKLHREDGPAYIEHYLDGSVRLEAFLINGKYHRNDGAAMVDYSYNGSVLFESFHLYGELLGSNKSGLWALWERLTEEERNNPNIIKLMLEYV